MKKFKRSSRYFPEACPASKFDHKVVPAARRSSIDAKLTAVRVQTYLKEATAWQLEGIGQPNADVLVLVVFLCIQPLAVVDGNIDHAPVSGTVEVVDHVLPPLLGEFRRPLKRETEVAFARRARIGGIRTIDRHALPRSLPVVPGGRDALEPGSEAEFFLFIEIPFSPCVAH